MNIIDERDKSKSRTLRELEGQTWFISSASNLLYVKLNDDNDRVDTEEDNVFCVLTRMLDYVSPDSIVQPVDVDVVIKRNI